MQTPSAAHRQRSARAMRMGPLARASSRSSPAATSIRIAPMTSAAAPARSTSTAVTDPVVPQEIAARQMKKRPRLAERRIGVSYGSRGDAYEDRIHRGGDDGPADARQSPEEGLRRRGLR